MNEAFINGFVKRAADYGVSKNEAIEILKQADHPYRQQEAAKVRALDEMIAANAYNRENHAGHYIFNPWVQGPVSEVVNRALRRLHAFQAHAPVVSEATKALNGGLLPIAMGGKKYKDRAREFKPEGYEEILKQVSEE